VPAAQPGSVRGCLRAHHRFAGWSGAGRPGFAARGGSESGIFDHRAPPGELRRLSELQPGDRTRITQVGGDGDTSRRLMDLGLIRGTAVEVVRMAPLGDPIEVRIRGFMLSLRRTEADHITVE